MAKIGEDIKEGEVIPLETPDPTYVPENPEPIRTPTPEKVPEKEPAGV
jgi:hypothetical protein